MSLWRRLLKFSYSLSIRTLFLLMVAAIVIVPDLFIFGAVYNLSLIHISEPTRP